MASIKSLLDQQLAINKKLASDALQKQKTAILSAASKLKPSVPDVSPKPTIIKDDDLKEGSIPWLKKALDNANITYKAKATKSDLQKLFDGISS